jgi:hypothetical protein
VYVSVDLFHDGNVRETVLTWRSKSYYAEIEATQRQNQMAKWREADPALAEAQKSLDAEDKTAATLSGVVDYTQAVLDNWKVLWAFHSQLKIRKARFRGRVLRQRALDRQVDRLCKPRKGDDKVLLVVGDAAKRTSGFKSARGLSGPVCKLIDRVVERKKAIVIYSSEFRTSKLDLFGEELVHPVETRAEHLEPAKCELLPIDEPAEAAEEAEVPSTNHVVGTPGCRCYCSAKGCSKLRKHKCFCDDHKKLAKRYNVGYSNSNGAHRMWNRDVIAAINIGCLFIALVRGVEDLSRWRHGSCSREPAKSWKEIFDGEGLPVPFSVGA